MKDFNILIKQLCWTNEELVDLDAYLTTAIKVMKAYENNMAVSYLEREQRNYRDMLRRRLEHD